MIQVWTEPSSHSFNLNTFILDRDHCYMFPLCHFPELPLAQTLLVKGDYHPSAPIHFCISHLSRDNAEGTAVFITPSKEAFVKTLVTYNDRWLGKYGGSGEVAAKLSRVKVLFVARIFRNNLYVGCLSREMLLATPRPFVNWPCYCQCCIALPWKPQNSTQSSC